MKYKEGRIGIQEGIAVTATALCINGVFSIDPEYAYSKGNSTYLSLPLSALLSLCLFLLVAAAMKHRGADSLEGLMRGSLGGVLSKVFAIPLMLALIIGGIVPIIQFVELLHGIVYSNSGYMEILAFIIPIIVIIAWQGTETIGRVAKCYVWLMLAMLVIVVASSAPTYETYRLYPILGDGAAHFASFTASQTFSFLPPLTALLITCRSMHGVEHAQRIGLSAGLVAALVCGLTQLSISFVYTYQTLADSFMPLYKINFLNLAESHFLRFDKLFAMVWLNGAIISSAFSLYAASLLYAGSFSQKDVNPSIAALSSITLGIILTALNMAPEKEKEIRYLFTRYGALLAAVPLAVTAIISLIKKKKETQPNEISH